MRIGLRVVLGASLLLWVAPVTADAGEGISETEIRVGMSAALSGGAQALGLGMRAGIEAYFKSLNDQGGIAGRKLRLIALDDEYEPSKSGPNMRRLIDQEDVFAVLGNTGTPTAAVGVPIANERKIPYVGAYTGAGILRKTPPDRFVVNYRASYAQETAEMVRGLLQEQGIKPNEIAFFTQNDAYGDAGHAGGVKALVAAGYERASRLPHARYPRNTLDVEGALAKLLDPRLNVKAVIMVGAYRPCAKFVKLAKKHGLKVFFVNVSFVGPGALAKELGAEGEGVVVTQVVPHFQETLAATSDYRKVLPEAEWDFISLEGYLVGRAFAEGIKRAGNPPTREGFISGLENGTPIDIGIGDPKALSKDKHQISDRVWPTVLRAGKYAPLRKWSDLAKP